MIVVDVTWVEFYYVLIPCMRYVPNICVCYECCFDVLHNLYYFVNLGLNFPVKTKKK